MEANTALHNLGFGPRDRVAVIHADDMGMCEATIPALNDIFEAGLVSSASVMVPCPWFPSAAAWSAAHPEADIGIHLTLTSEWEHYRWRPLSTQDAATGLVDPWGFMPKKAAAIEEQAQSQAVVAEMRAQIERARQFGMNLSHLDSHMYSVMKKFLGEYLRVSCEAGLTPLVLRSDVARWKEQYSHGSSLPEHDFPVFDHLVSPSHRCPLDEHEQNIFDGFSTFEPGLTCYLLHPATDTPELRTIVPNWAHRVLEWRTFSSKKLKDHVRDCGIQVVTYGMLASAMAGASRAQA
jgi:hypothetical protein